MIIDVVIPTVAGREVSLKRCIKAYEERSANTVRLHVVENYPTCGSAWNRGVEWFLDEGPGDFLHLSADDLEPLAGWDIAAKKAIRAGQQPSPKLINPDLSVAYYGRLFVEPPDGTPVVMSTIPFMPWRLWDEIGPSLDCHYFTDDWLSLKAERAGLPSAYWSKYAFIHHHETPGRGAGMSQDERMIHDREIYDRALDSLVRE